ncbi:MAG TPA: glycosyltransferase family 39 protein, partial [Vicinamibacterales bacterium]|nr:glycosyltransferase family 39 protein [Vicinamibacterales bacterium]
MTRDVGWRTAGGLALLIVAVLLVLAQTTTLWDRDEPRFAQAAVEMLASRDYLVPTFNGELRAQKPPLVYWLMTRSIAVLGPTELACRLWSPIGIAIAALATFAIGRRFWSARVGLVAMAVLALTPLTVMEGVAATTDAILLASFTGSLAIVSAMLSRSARWWDAAALGATMGAGLLTKGPVALLLPTLIAALACWGARRHVSSKWRFAICLVAAGVIAVSIYAVWLVPAALATSGQMVAQGLIRENLWRALEPMESHGTPMAVAPFYYPAVIAIGFAPWVCHFPVVFRRFFVDTAGDPRLRALLIAWITVPLVAFSLAATKLPHYILPIWPALALLVAAALTDMGRQTALLTGPLRRMIYVSVGLVIVIAGLASTIERVKLVPSVASA